MDIPATIELKVDEAHTLRLQGLGTAGYVWNCTVAGDTNTIDVMIDKVNQPQQVNFPIVHGSSLDEVVTILGQKPGKAILHLVQSRPWETNQPPLKDYRIEVIVQL